MTRYVKEMGGALLAYAVVLVGSIRVLHSMPELPQYSKAWAFRSCRRSPCGR